MAQINPQQIAVTGSVPTYAAVSASDVIAPDGNDNLFLHVKNGGGSTDNVNIVVPGVYLGVAIADIPVSVPAGTEAMIAIPAAAMNPATGLITVMHSFITSVTQALLRR